MGEVSENLAFKPDQRRLQRVVQGRIRLEVGWLDWTSVLHRSNYRILQHRELVHNDGETDHVHHRADFQRRHGLLRLNLYTAAAILQVKGTVGCAQGYNAHQTR